MDIGRAFSFVFEDEEWITIILIGGLIMLVPILGQIVLLGFLFETARNVVMGQSRPLPRWNHLGETFTNGLPTFVIQIVYSLPVLLLVCAFSCFLMLSGGAMGRNEDAIAGMAMLSMFCFMPLMLIIALVLQPITLAAMVRHIQTGELSPALKVGDVIAMVRSNLSGWLILWLLQILCGLVASVGSVAFGVGALFTSVYAAAVFGHLLGQMTQQTLPAGMRPL
ncbi:DUF4013 domain-containing protein [Candidatus Oscillochloris fontis]|uniref:DUF4013 domain-containing protein n=1 Tax=Candidatus Oscillochloris fontis TaxID=2496868 RepID=UPI00101DDE08|nr:DUF4013 domain-containing protein [Candidatus Oscillochloris fontis]